MTTVKLYETKASQIYHCLHEMAHFSPGREDFGATYALWNVTQCSKCRVTFMRNFDVIGITWQKYAYDTEYCTYDHNPAWYFCWWLHSVGEFLSCNFWQGEAKNRLWWPLVTLIKTKSRKSFASAFFLTHSNNVFLSLILLKYIWNLEL